MIEIGSSEIDADELMTEVRKDGARESVGADDSPLVGSAQPQASRGAAAEDLPAEDEPVPSPAHKTLSLRLPVSPPPVSIPPLGLQPTFRPNSNDRYHINDLLQYHDRHFVESAYLATLKRPAGARELASDLDELRSGRLGKQELIERLLLSTEGREAKVEVAGRGSSIVKSLIHLPALGYLLRLAKGLLRLPVMMRHQQQFELYALAQQQSIVDYVNDAVEQITEQRRGTYQAFTEHQRDIHKVFAELSESIAELSETCGMLAEALAETSTSSHILAELPTEVAGLRRQIKELREAQQSVAEINQELLIHEQSVIVETQKAALGRLQSRLDELRHGQQQLSVEIKSQEQLALLLFDKVRNRVV